MPSVEISRGPPLGCGAPFQILGPHGKKEQVFFSFFFFKPRFCLCPLSLQTTYRIFSNFVWDTGFKFYFLPTHWERFSLGPNFGQSLLSSTPLSFTSFTLPLFFPSLLPAFFPSFLLLFLPLLFLLFLFFWEKHMHKERGVPTVDSFPNALNGQISAKTQTVIWEFNLSLPQK